MAPVADFLSATTLDRKLRAIRHLEGDQTDHWGYHVGQWFPERFVATFKALGYSDIEVTQQAADFSPKPPLFNVLATAVKRHSVDRESQVRSACRLLEAFMVADAEAPTMEAWRKQVVEALEFRDIPAPRITTLSIRSPLASTSRFARTILARLRSQAAAVFARHLE